MEPAAVLVAAGIIFGCSESAANGSGRAAVSDAGSDHTGGRMSVGTGGRMSVGTGGTGTGGRGGAPAPHSDAQSPLEGDILDPTLLGQACGGIHCLCSEIVLAESPERCTIRACNGSCSPTLLDNCEPVAKALTKRLGNPDSGQVTVRGCERSTGNCLFAFPSMNLAADSGLLSDLQCEPARDR